MKTRIAIAEDNTWLLKSILQRLEGYDDLDIRFTARDGQEFQDKLRDNPHIDLVLMDIEMPKVDGIQATKFVKDNFPQIKVVMITVFDDNDKLFKAIQAGADGYLLKEVSHQDLYKGVKNALEGGAAMTPDIAMKALKLLRTSQIEDLEVPAEDYRLSKRETEVLEQLASGLSYTKIADNLFLSPSTVRKHIENIYKKLRVHSKLEAVEKARRERLI